MSNHVALAALLLALTPPPAVGFNPPEDRQGGWRAAITGVPDVHDLGGDPLRFTVTLACPEPEGASGQLTVRLNDEDRKSVV